MIASFLMTILAATVSGDVTSKPTGEVMLVGTYHLANNNRDIVNLPVEDVLTAKRQAEIEQLVRGFAKWRPTKVAVEWPRDDQAGLDKRYAEYLSGSLKVTANERDQVAFRLARMAGLKRVEAIDWNDAFPGTGNDYDFAGWAKRNGQADRFARFVQDGQAEAQRNAASMRVTPVAEWYRALNSPAERVKMHQPYFTIATFGTNKENPGAAWVGGWYARNLRIFNNMREHLGAGERLFVLYGAGHTYMLDNFIRESGAAGSIDPRRYIAR